MSRRKLSNLLNVIFPWFRFHFLIPNISFLFDTITFPFPCRWNGESLPMGSTSGIMVPTWRSSSALTHRSGFHFLSLSLATVFAFSLSQMLQHHSKHTGSLDRSRFTFLTMASLTRITSLTRFAELTQKFHMLEWKWSPGHRMLKRTSRWSSLGFKLYQASTFPFHENNLFCFLFCHSIMGCFLHGLLHISTSQDRYVLNLFVRPVELSV